MYNACSSSGLVMCSISCVVHVLQTSLQEMPVFTVHQLVLHISALVPVCSGIATSQLQPERNLVAIINQ